MSRALLLGCGIVFLCLPRSARSVEAAPDTLPPGAVARLGWSPLRIGNADFALTPDGRNIIVVTPQGNLRRLDAQTGRLLERRQLTDRSDVDPRQPSGVQLSANGQTVALEEVSYTGPRVTVYDVSSGKKSFQRASTEERRIGRVLLSPDGKHLAICEDGDSPRRTRLRVFDLKTGRMRDLGALYRDTLGFHFSGDGERLLLTQHLPPKMFTSTLGLVERYALSQLDLTSGKELWRRSVEALNFAVSRDGNVVLASGSRDANRTDFGFHVIEMDAVSKKVSERFLSCRVGAEPSKGGPPIFSDFSIAPDNRMVVTNYFNEIYLWDLRTGNEIRHFTLPKYEGVVSFRSRMRITDDKRTLLTNAGYLQRWDLTSGKPLFKPPPDDGLVDFPIQIAFTPDGKEILDCSNQWFLGRWNVATRKRIDLRRIGYGGTPFLRTPSGLRAIRVDARGRRFQFTIFDPLIQKSLHTISWPIPQVGVRDLRAFSLTNDGQTFLAIHLEQNAYHVTAWDVASRYKLSDFDIPADRRIEASPFSPCGRWVMLGGKLYHIGSGSELFAPVGPPSGEEAVYGPAWFSEDGRLMADHLGTWRHKAPSEDILAVWELASGKPLARLANAAFVARAAFAPDGRTLAVQDAHGIRVEDLLSGKRLATYPAPDVVCGNGGHGSERQGLVFAPDGSLLATGHEDGTIVLWKVPRPQEGTSAALADDEIDKLWQALGSSSPSTARAAVDRLSRHPEAAMALLATRFRPTPPKDNLAALIQDLDSDVFATREEASRKLHAYGAKAATALRRALTQRPSLEMRRRIENLLTGLKPLPLQPLRLPLAGKRLRGVRAIEVLERIGDTDARQMLREWTEQTEDAALAQEAQLVLERLDLGDAKRRPGEKKQVP